MSDLKSMDLVSTLCVNTHHFYALVLLWEFDRKGVKEKEKGFGEKPRLKRGQGLFSAGARLGCAKNNTFCEEHNLRGEGMAFYFYMMESNNGSTCLLMRISVSSTNKKLHQYAHGFQLCQFEV